MSEESKILSEIKEKGWYNIAVINTPLDKIRALENMEYDNLIYKKNENIYALTSDGDIATKVGGYEKWKELRTSNHEETPWYKFKKDIGGWL